MLRLKKLPERVLEKTELKS